MFYDRIKYRLEYYGTKVVIEEPKNWDTSNVSFIRNDNYHGITPVFSDEIEFVGEGSKILSDVFDTYGVNADVKLVIEKRDPDTDIYFTYLSGWIDFISFSKTSTTFKAKLNTDKYTSLLKSRQSINVEIENKEDLDGKTLDTLNLAELYIEGREILETNKLTQPNDPVFLLKVGASETVMQSLDIKEAKDKKNSGNIDIASVEITDYRVLATTAAYGYFFIENISGEAYEFSLEVNHKQSLFWSLNGVTDVHLVYRLAFYTSNTFVSDIVLFDNTYNVDNIPIGIDITYNDKIIIPDNTRITLEVLLDVDGSSSRFCYLQEGYNYIYGSDDKYYLDNNGEWKAAYLETSVVAYTDTEKEPTDSNGIMAYELTERVLKMILGSGVRFRSDILARQEIDDYSDDGILSETAFVHGLWLRGMKQGDSRFQSMKVNFKDLYNALDMIYPIGLSIEDDLVKIEDRDSFYKIVDTIDLGEVTDLIISPDEKLYSSSIIIGDSKSGGYDNDQGLDEFNRKTEYSTPIAKTSTKTTINSKLRIDGYALERARRDNPLIDPDANWDDDKNSDNNIWMLDVIKNNKWELKRWAERFEEAPKNVYSKDTVINLWYSAINTILKHGKYLKQGLTKNLNDKIRYASSDGNSKIETKLIGGKWYAQNDGVPIIDLDKSISNGLKASFNAPVTYSELTGKTKGIRNVDGLINFTYKDVKYKGFLIDVKRNNGIGEFKLRLFS